MLGIAIASVVLVLAALGMGPRILGSSDSSFREVFDLLWNRSVYMYREGYDVIHAQYLLLSSKYYYYEVGYAERAWELLENAANELDDAVLRPELPPVQFRIYNCTLYINRTPTVWDFVPLGTVFALSDSGYLVYPRNDPRWKLSCFIMVGIGRNGNGGYFGYQGRLPLMPLEGSFRPRVFLNGAWHTLDITFAGPLYYDDHEHFSNPTVYQFDLSGRFLQYITYVEENRTWIHRIVDMGTNETLLSIVAHAFGVPMWIGAWNESYLVHGVYAKIRDLDLWSGFWDLCDMVATLDLAGHEGTYQGQFLFDRASHRVCESNNSLANFGPPLSFSCMAIFGDNFTLTVSSSVNPSPWEPEHRFEHQMRIYMRDLDACIDLADFDLSYDAGLQPSRFSIFHSSSDVYINLSGEVVSYWPSRWVVGRGCWWDGGAAYSWGRAFILWEGTIAYHGHTIRVSALGAGEFTRCVSGIAEMPFP